MAAIGDGQLWPGLTVHISQRNFAAKVAHSFLFIILCVAAYSAPSTYTD